MPLYSSFRGDEVVLADDALPVADKMMERTEGALVDEAWGLCSCALAALQELGRHFIALRCPQLMSRRDSSRAVC